MDRSDLEPVTLERLLALCRRGAAAGRLLGRIGPVGLTVVQLGILADLDRSGALHLRELARRQSCRRQSVDEAVRSLAAAGWIRRIPHDGPPPQPVGPRTRGCRPTRPSTRSGGRLPAGRSRPDPHGRRAGALLGVVTG